MAGRCAGVLGRRDAFPPPPSLRKKKKLTTFGLSKNTPPLRLSPCPANNAGGCAAADPGRGARPAEVERRGRAHQGPQRQELSFAVSRGRAGTRAHLLRSLPLSLSLTISPAPASHRVQHQNTHRWWNHLNPAVKKGAFSDWEDAVIIKVRGAAPFFPLRSMRLAALDGGSETPNGAAHLVLSPHPPATHKKPSSSSSSPGARAQRQQVVGYVCAFCLFAGPPQRKKKHSASLTRVPPPSSPPRAPTKKTKTHKQSSPSCCPAAPTTPSRTGGTRPSSARPRPAA